MKKSTFLFSLLIVFLVGGLWACGSGNEHEKSSTALLVPTPAGSSPELVAQLNESALEGDMTGVKVALKAGADVKGTDEDGRTALMFASFNGHSEIVLELLDAGADIQHRDAMGRTSLLYAATGPFPETVKILVDKGAEPNVIDSDEHFTPLMHAAAEGNLDVVKILLKAGSDHTLIDVDGDNAASFARQAGHTEVADHLDAL